MHPPTTPSGAAAPEHRLTITRLPPAETARREAEFRSWWSERHERLRFSVDRIAFSEMGAWGFDEETGNLVHSSGKFFTVEGVRVDGGSSSWTRPIINQPEIGLLGILLKDIDGVPHGLMQAKMEPGNVNVLQISPTLQATRSNFTRVHQGAQPHYLEFFTDPPEGSVLADVLQSEQGAWFWRKLNRNMVVRLEPGHDVPEHEDYRWLPLDLVLRLLREDDLVNMDTRTVLSCMPFVRPDTEGGSSQGDGPAEGRWASAVTASCPDGSGTGPGTDPRSLLSLLSWITNRRSVTDESSTLVPLSSVTGWLREKDELRPAHGGAFSIVGVSVEAGNREVRRWTQPLLAPHGLGLAVLLARVERGVLWLLMRARFEPGLPGQVELAPTVQVPPGEEPDESLPFLEEARTSDERRLVFDTVLSEEGGRFHHARTRYRVVEAPRAPTGVPDGYRWLTLAQVMELLKHSHYLNVEARSLIACVHSIRA
ncbi:NDP-hexose 2,3-dehydratase family protein [Nocardiopsis dassonvillei]